MPLILTSLQAKRIGFAQTGKEIIKKESFLALYKGLGAVMTGIVPKMAIRFTSYGWYKQALADKDGNVSGQATFLGEQFLPLNFMSLLFQHLFPIFGCGC